MTTNQAPRIGGWLYIPLAWLLLALLNTSIVLAMYGLALISLDGHQTIRQHHNGQIFLWYLSLFSTLAMWCYTLWLVIAFFKRRGLVRKHYIIWLLTGVLLALKGFAFSPISDELALRQLLFPLLAAAVFAPCFRRSVRVQNTFINS
ncbi:DUF2569 family protein [Erwinia sp. CPCC 100877]|nr:DUF2569 family protein [Erwinia sp. CPCC 100877]